MTGRADDLKRVMHGTLLGEAMLEAEVASLVADERGYYVAASDYAAELTGYSRDHLTQLRAGELAADDESRRIYEHLASRKKLQGRKNIRRKDGAILHCRYWGIPTTVGRLPYYVLLLWPAKPKVAA